MAWVSPRLLVLSFCVGAGWAVVGAFETPVIRDTAYAFPNDAYFVATSGNDGGPGTEAAPFETVGHAIDVAPAGSTIVIRGGTYREPGKTFSKPLTLQPYPHEQVWLKGSVVVTGWVADGAAWRKDGWTHEFDPNTHPPGAIDPLYPYAGMPDMVFIDGDPLAQVGSLSEIGPGKFFVDNGADRLYVGDDPTGRTVEASAHDRALRANTGSAGTVIRGLGFMHYAGDRFAGTLQCDSAFTVFENNTVAWGAARGIAVYTSAAEVRGNTLIYNGLLGLAVWRADGLVVDRNRIAANNQERFVRSGDFAEAAGAKITETRGLSVRDNVVEDNLANGLWLDVSIHDAVLAGNVVRSNEGNGIYYEISSNGIVASNVVVGNDSGIVASNAANVKVFNNTLVANAEHLAVVDDSRVNGDSEEIGLGITWITDSVELKNNLLSDGDGSATAFLYARDFNSVPIKDADDMISASDHNAYHRSDSSVPAFLVEWWRGTTRLDFADLPTFRQQTGEELNGLALDDVPDPFFVDAAGGNYRLKPGSLALDAGASLPQDVADAIGVPAASPVDLGAFVGLSGADPPTPVPDGSNGSSPMLASRTGASGADIAIDRDSICSTYNVKLIFGPLAGVSTYSISGSVCSTSDPFTWKSVPPESIWFLLVGDNAFDVESSWGLATGGERNGSTASGTCGATSKDVSGGCL